MYSNFQWWSYASDGSSILHVGTYLICDGGYHKWQELIPPYKNQVDGTDQKRWSKWVESLRKDVECSFGIMKKQFRNIKNRSRYHNKETLETIFYCCAIMHNMNHHYDRYDDKVHDAQELQDLHDLQNNQQQEEATVHNHFAAYGLWTPFQRRREALIKHFAYCKDELGKNFANHQSY